MLISDIISFLSTQGTTAYAVDELRDIREYQPWDAKHTINRKKTAKYNKLMTNVYEPDIHIHTHIIQVTSNNRQNGYMQSFSQKTQEFLNILKQTIHKDPQSTVTITTTDTPSKSMYSLKKTLVISDFLRDDKLLNEFIHHCSTGNTRGIILPLLTPTGIFKHPVIIKYPDFFWELE